MDFRNKPYPDFNNPDHNASMQGALNAIDSVYAGRDWPHVLLGRDVMGADKYMTHDPNNPSTVVGTFQRFDPAAMDVDALMLGARKASEGWRKVDMDLRAQIVEKAADLMEDRIMLISAGLVREVGKSYIEAYAGVAEAIDFLRYNAILAREEQASPLAKSPGSCGNTNKRALVPHGVFLSLDPFNFQVAIGTDQIAKPILMGNAVIASPSDKSSLCGRLLFQVFLDAFQAIGVDSAGIINWAPGGADMAIPILKHPELTGLCFTGSAKVLDTIIMEYGMIRRSNGGKLVIAGAETSGVDALYVHEDADLDVAAKGAAAALCGLSGQKCSALSTLIVHENVQTQLLDRIAAVIDELTFGPTADGCYLGAVISAESRDRITDQYQELMMKTGVCKAYEKSIPSDLPGFNVPPTILQSAPASGLSRQQLETLRNTEIFGPVCTMIPVVSAEEAETVFNMSDFALTGGICTQDPELAEHAVQNFRSGNFYVNRKITGALVGSEPFGGLVSRSSLFGISAGSRHALTLFYSDKTISGFMP